MDRKYCKFTTKVGAYVWCLSDWERLIDGDGQTETEHIGWYEGAHYYFTALGDTYKVQGRDVIKCEETEILYAEGQARP